MVTPLLASLRINGGTLYTFSSASRDLTKIFTDSRYSFTFSHFACLNLPDVKNGKYESGMEKGLYLETLLSQDEFTSEHPNEYMFEESTSINMALAENLQNYVMNFETTILNGMGDNDDYDDSQIRTVSERIFFNWLQKVGAIEFVSSDNNGYYKESSIYKDCLVKYIGKIDILNSVDVAGDAYDEIYIHIPGSVGGSAIAHENENDTYSFIKFVSPSDTNYDNTRNSYESITEDNIIIGRHELVEDNESNQPTSDFHPYGLSLKGIYDDNESQLYTVDKGYCIDFREETYGTDSNSIMELNEQSKTDFEFNCVLLYYTLTDNTTNKSYTNLYGVLFLEEITPINTDDSLDEIIKRGYIQRYPKIAGGESGNGNSYALKVDLKIDTLPDTTMTSTSYTDANDDYAGALEIYTQSLLQIQSLVNRILEDKKEISSLQDRVDYLENQLSLINKIPSLENDIERLDAVINYGDTIIDGKNILDLIESNSNKIDTLVNGKVSAKLTVDSSSINSGYGIGITSDDNGKIEISNTIGLYNIRNFYTTEDEDESYEITYDNPLSLYKESSSEFNAYTSIGNGNNCSILYVKDTCNNNLYLHIADYSWKTGQSLKIKINSISGDFASEQTTYKTTSAPIIKIFCGSVDITESNPIYAYNYTGLEEIEVICIDENASEYYRKFIYDIKVK